MHIDIWNSIHISFEYQLHVINFQVQELTNLAKSIWFPTGKRTVFLTKFRAV